MKSHRLMTASILLASMLFLRSPARAGEAPEDFISLVTAEKGNPGPLVELVALDAPENELNPDGERIYRITIMRETRVDGVKKSEQELTFSILRGQRKLIGFGQINSADHSSGEVIFFTIKSIKALKI